MKTFRMAAIAAVALMMVVATSAFAQVCDVTYTMEVETADGHDVSSASATTYADPLADVLDDHKRQIKVLDYLSKHQDKGGPYTIELGEYRACDGAAKTKVVDGSVQVQGVTLAAANAAARLAYKEWDGILKRYEDRADKGAKTGWDHKKAKKVRRDASTGVKLKE